MADKILTVGERIKQIRINNGLTFSQFGGFLDATAEYVKDVENNKVTPTHEFIHVLCWEFGMPEEYFNPTFTLGERIKIVRESRGLTQTDFSDELGITQAHTSKMEHDTENPSDTVLKLISCKFNVSYNFLKFGNEPMEQKADADTQKKDDVSRLINQFLELEEFNYSELDEQLYDSNDEWRTTKQYIDTQFENLKAFVVGISGNNEKKNSIGRLEDSVSNLQHMWGNACFLEGLKKGLLMMQWAKGQANATGTIL